MAPEPTLLAPFNFTPASRTPWGGRRILARFGEPPPEASSSREVVGESWEISAEPDFPSHTVDGRELGELFAEDPVGWLGEEEAARGGSSLLVKLVDAASPLSVQIHPEDDDPELGAEESGKPEAWYVVERDPGAGVYIGLIDGVTPDAMRTAVERGDDVSRLLAFTEVEHGDFFVIDAGTPHALGAGVLLVEPQRVAPGKRGVTYRYWDWNRRYGARGRPDPAGAPRELHLEAALRVTRWEAPRGEALLSTIRHRAGPASPTSPARIEPLCGSLGKVASSHLEVSRLSGSGAIELENRPTLHGLTVLEGSVSIRGSETPLVVEAGRSAVVPACRAGVALELSRAHAILSAIA